jgi:hypothetical protein
VSPLPAGWNQLTVVVNNAGRLVSFYLNGQPIGAAALPTYVLQTTAPLLFGQAEGLSFNGLMNDVAIYNRALSAQEVAALVSSTSPSPSILLSSLTVNPGVLSPAFSTQVSAYSTVVSSPTITVKPTAGSPTSTVTVDGAAVASGASSAPIPLTQGASKRISILVGSSRTYTVTATRIAEPTVTIPASPVVVQTTSASGAVATFSVTAHDGLGHALVPIVTPASGTLFPVGNTTVSATATDTYGGSTTRTFTVRVQEKAKP